MPEALLGGGRERKCWSLELQDALCPIFKNHLENYLKKQI